MTRTHHSGELRAEHVGDHVRLAGWAQTTRDHGGLIFIDLRDRSGVVQVVFDPAQAPKAHEAAQRVRSEYVLAVAGEVTRRPEGTENPDMPTGQVEVRAQELEILNASRTPPFEIADDKPVDEMVRLRYRHLDLRTGRMQRNLRVRHEMAQAVRGYLNAQGFWEIETPLLIRSTPEGARDFLVPCRLQPGKFYALPQSPQLLKQLLMASGMERYYQIARCLRDEDLRADRQPEFTQIDLEMSFADEEAVIAVSEGITQAALAAAGVQVTPPFPRLTYREAMDRFGTDKPDLRYGMELKDISECFRETQFRVFRQALEQGSIITALAAPGCGEFSRARLDALVDAATKLGARGLVWMVVEQDGLRSPVAKHLSEDEQRAVTAAAGAAAGDLILIAADERDRACSILGSLRQQLAGELGLAKAGDLKLLWVTDFPLFERGEDGAVQAMHHPFSSPKEEDLALLDSEPLAVRGRLYDLVLDGNEIASGSIRIHRRDLQEQVLRLINMPLEEAQRRFGFLLEAFEYGAPPHGGIAFGFDRLVALAVGEESIREVIAFPKTAAGTDPLTRAPTDVDAEQLAELDLRLVPRKPQAPGDDKTEVPS
ncbi:MAG: aspartate--tRNA ligase [Armatimonadota bacterium]|nr:MAG: aspartate--tRNA ligase [Armatimonadota bacterium]